MLDHDISTADARRLLSVRADGPDLIGPYGWTRRRFLQAVGLGVVGGAAVGTLADGLIPGEVHDAFAAPIGPNDGILVTIMMYGGNDGLNTVVPYADPLYYAQRGGVAVPANDVLAINGQIGFNPRLGYLKGLYDAGQVAVVRGVGYPDPDLSHFTSMAIWMNGRFGGGPASTGWLGRWLDGLPAENAELAVATIDTSVPLHLVGANRRAVGISPWGDIFGTGTHPADQGMYDGIRAMRGVTGRGQWHDMYASTMATQLNLAGQIAPVFSTPLPEGDLVSKITVAARMINANIGVRVVDMGYGTFDTHDSQLASHPDLLGQLNDALVAFYQTLSPSLHDRVTIMTVSEFGRTTFSNGSGGTDHGTANDLFVIGSKVRGGLYGQGPTLAGLTEWDRLPFYVDFRQMYGSVIDGWMGGGASTVLGGSFEDLHLFTGGPGPGGGAPGPVIVVPPAPAAAAGFVATAPLRVLDTRDGTGGRSTPLGTEEAWPFVLAGQHGIPADAVAVALNLTSVDATAATFVTVYPAGVTRPTASNLNPVPGLAIPNLVVARVGAGGGVELYNNTGTVHLVADVVGWFVPSGGNGMEALEPARLLDTRDGTGGVLGAVGPGQTIELQVSGRGGVSADSVAVALNITATEPTDGSYLTVWPAGQERPLASSVNMVPGQTVPNLVLARLGEGGKVAIYNNSGSSHVVVDVLGCFGSDVSTRFVSVSPVRALDTREGVGAPRARVQQQDAVALRLAGHHGIPSSGVSAVLLNVIAVAPSAGTYVTVYPSGRARPNASNLNAVAGQVVPNIVIATLGPDGSAAIFNNAGDIDLVADVMGYFVG